MKRKFVHYGLVVLHVLLALFMINAGVQHFLRPNFYTAFVPAFVPLTEIVIFLFGVLEIVLGVSLFLPGKISRYGALMTVVLMFIFLPIHVADLCLAEPAIGSYQAAWVRLFVQFIFIVWAWFIYRFLRTKQQKEL